MKTQNHILAMVTIKTHVALTEEVKESMELLIRRYENSFEKRTLKGEKVITPAHYHNNLILMLQVLELRRQIEKQSTDLGATHRSLSDLRSKNAELEERLIQINKEMHQSQEIAKSLECELNENVAQKGDQEERIATLEKRLLII